MVHYWATALKNRGHRVIVPTMKPAMRAFNETMKFPYEVDRYPHLPYLAYASRWMQFRRIHRRFPIDIIHANFLYHAGYVGLRLQKSFGIPCVATAQGADIHVYEGTGYGNIRDPRIRKMTEEVIGGLAGVIYTSEKIRQSICDHGGNPEKMHYVVNGSPCDKIVSSKREIIRQRLGLGEHDIMFLAVSRHSPIKGLDLVVQAAKLLGPARTKFKIVMAGLKTEGLLPVIRENGLDDLFDVVGTLPIEMDEHTRIPKMPSQAIVDYLCAADVFLAPALSGGFELSAMDAMAAGLAIIISSNIGNQDLVTNDKNGYVVENNNPVQIAEAMKRVLDDPAKARRMGQFNREFAKQFDWNRIAEKLEMVYKDVMEKWKYERKPT